MSSGNSIRVDKKGIEEVNVEYMFEIVNSVSIPSSSDLSIKFPTDFNFWASYPAIDILLPDFPDELCDLISKFF